jgi:hypothetical protein
MRSRRTWPILVAILAIVLLTAVTAAVLLASAGHDETAPATTPAASGDGVTYAPRVRA